MKGVFLIVSPLQNGCGCPGFRILCNQALTATILYHKGYGLSLIQQVLRHQNPSTTERYLRSFGIEKVREGLEGAFVRKPAEVIPFSKQKTSNV
jgi:integrase